MFETILYLLTYPKRMDPMVIFATWGSIACVLASIAIAMHIIRQGFLLVTWAWRKLAVAAAWYRSPPPVPEAARSTSVVGALLKNPNEPERER